MRFLLFMVGCVSLAQSTFINCGGPALQPIQGPPAIPAYAADGFFTGGASWIDATMGAGVYGSLRYAPSFSYDIPEQNGFYYVQFRFVEPNKTAVGQRLFTVTANGVQSDPIDVFQMAGGINRPASMWLITMVGNGHLRIQFNATAGNAIVSAIEVQFIWITLPQGPPTPIAVTTPALPNGVVGVAYSAKVNAIGGYPPYTWSAIGLPQGLSISSAGVISGTPTVAGLQRVVVTARDTPPPFP